MTMKNISLPPFDIFEACRCNSLRLRCESTSRIVWNPLIETPDVVTCETDEFGETILQYLNDCRPKKSGFKVKRFYAKDCDGNRYLVKYSLKFPEGSEWFQSEKIVTFTYFLENNGSKTKITFKKD